MYIHSGGITGKMAGEQSQFEGLLQNLLSTDNKIRVEAEVIELLMTCKITVLCLFYSVGLIFIPAECLYTSCFPHVVFL